MQSDLTVVFRCTSWGCASPLRVCSGCSHCRGFLCSSQLAFATFSHTWLIGRAEVNARNRQAELLKHIFNVIYICVQSISTVFCLSHSCITRWQQWGAVKLFLAFLKDKRLRQDSRNKHSPVGLCYVCFLGLCHRRLVHHLSLLFRLGP